MSSQKLRMIKKEIKKRGLSAPPPVYFWDSEAEFNKADKAGELDPEGVHIIDDFGEDD